MTRKLQRLPGMLRLALTMTWINASSSDVPAAKATGSRKRSPSPGRAAAVEGMPKDIMKAVELVMDWNKMELVERLGWVSESAVWSILFVWSAQDGEAPRSEDRMRRCLLNSIKLES